MMIRCGANKKERPEPAWILCELDSAPIRVSQPVLSPQPEPSGHLLYPLLHAACLAVWWRVFHE